MSDGHNQDIGELKASVDFLREGLAEFRQEVRDGMRELREGTKDRMDDHSKRIRSLEGWKDRLSGAKGYPLGSDHTYARPEDVGKAAITWSFRIGWAPFR